MKNFEQIKKDDALSRLMNKEEVFAFGFTIKSNGTMTPFTKRLRDETIGTISNIINGENVVLYVKNS